MVYEGQKSRSSVARQLLLKVTCEAAAKVSAGAAACEELTEVHVALGRSVSSSPWGSLHRTTHNMAPSGASDERGRERTGKRDSPQDRSCSHSRTNLINDISSLTPYAMGHRD